MRRYLDKIGLKRKYRPEGWNKPFSRTIKGWFQKFIYNVDPRETYDLDFSWHMWLYEHLLMFKKKATEVVDLTECKWEYNGNTYSQLDLIDMMIERLEFCLGRENSCPIYDEKEYEYVSEIEKIWALICPSMWW